jgi:hypothetical protein
VAIKRIRSNKKNEKSKKSMKTNAPATVVLK